MADQPWCAYCRLRPVEPRWRPFCSERCKLTDLGRWLKGDYRVPGAALNAFDAVDEDDPEATARRDDPDSADH